MLGIISNANFRISENRQYFYSFLRIELSDKKIPNFQEKIKVFQDMVQQEKCKNGSFCCTKCLIFIFCPFWNTSIILCISGRRLTSLSLYYYLWLFGNFYGSKSTIQVLGPRIWVPKIKMHKKEVEPWLWTQYPGPNKCPKGWQIILDPFARTQMLGPKCHDIITVTNVLVSTKSTVGISEHSFKLVDEGR